MGLQTIHQALIDNTVMTKEQADSIISKFREDEMSIDEIDEYLENEYSLLGMKWCFYEADIKQATVDEANDYIKEALSQETYTAYFARKYVDYLSVFIVFFSIVMLAFLFYEDSKKDIYELLHTKPIKPRQYIVGKILGGVIAISLVVIIITAVFTGLAMYRGIKAGFPVCFLDLWWMVLLYIVPILMMVTCVYTLISVLFKNPLPALPLLLLYAIYSNLLGTSYVSGRITYNIPRLAILIRFPGTFFETSISGDAIINQIILAAVACLIAVISIVVWERRRVY